MTDTTRLDRVEAWLESSARAIQVLTDNVAAFRLTVAEDRGQAKEERQELRQAMLGIANLLASLDEDRPTLLRRLSAIESKIDRLLDQSENP
ncbi:MAG: hypothetical protein VKJ46_14020 [Leptolyngbyaceae bacterium]|nr:hypothetical protein [Leptolyngbyaceae bacterium]